MNLDSNQKKSPCSPTEALAMKNAALRAVLGYLEHRQGVGEWYKDELAYRFHRMVEIALAAPCKLETENQNHLLSADHQFEHQS